MKVRLVELLSHGARRTKQDCRADRGEFGELLIGADGKAVFQQVYDHREIEGRPALVRAGVIQITRKGFVVQGLQRAMIEGEERWLAQEWWCEPQIQASAR